MYLVQYCVLMLILNIVPGASIAIDDCYELWESGFVSIPHDFELRDLRPQLQKLLQGAATESQEQVASQAEPFLYPDTEAPEPGYNGDEWKHNRYYLDERIMDSSASKATSEALAGVPTEPQSSSSSISEYSGGALSARWPLRMASTMPQQARIACRLGRAYKRHEPLSTPARRWRSSHRQFPEATPPHHSLAR